MISLFKSSPNFYALLALMHGQTDKAPGGERDYHSFVFDIGAGYLYSITPRVILRAERAIAPISTTRRRRASTRAAMHSPTAYSMSASCSRSAISSRSPKPQSKSSPRPSRPSRLTPTATACRIRPTSARIPRPAEPVNAQGCPLDSDGDGVPDAVDECPKSPAGAKVLANGCALVGDCRTPRAGEQVDANGCAAEQNFILKGVKFEFDSDRSTQAAQLILNDVAGHAAVLR